MQRVVAPQRTPLTGLPALFYNLKTVPITLARRIALQRTNAASDARSSASASSTTDEYLSWASASGISFPKVTQAYFGELRGSKALEPIEPEEFFVSVPRSAALVIEPTGRCPCPDFVTSEFWKQAPWYIKMATLLLKESARGKASPVWGYIIQLPESIDTPVRWTDKEIEQLQYAPLIAEIRQQRTVWKEQYDKFKQAAKGLGGDGVSYERFLWAAENVRSRAFSGPYAGAPFSDRLKLGGFVAAAGLAYVTWAHVPLEQALNGAIAAAVFNLLYDVVLSSKLKWFALCPVIDAINHSSKVESTIEYEYFKDTFVASTNTAYVPSEQVFISYGAQSNGPLFQYYGFFEPGNKHDVYEVRAEVGGKQVKLVIQANGNLTPASLKEAREITADLDDTEFRKQVLAAMEAERDSEPTTLADDERQLETAHMLAPRLKAAIEFRVEKKKLLKRGILRASKRAALAAGEPMPR